MSDEVKPTEAQLKYAASLHKFSILGLGFLIVAFLLYIFGVLSNTTPPSEIPSYWKLPADQYIAATGAYTGWSWLPHILSGNILSFASLVYLSMVSIIAFFTILPVYERKGDKYYVLIVSVQILVLVIAASGWITGGGH